MYELKTRGYSPGAHKAPSGQHKIIDQWEDKQYQVLSQPDDQPVFKVQPENVVDDENIRVCIVICYFLYKQLKIKVQQQPLNL